MLWRVARVDDGTKLSPERPHRRAWPSHTWTAARWATGVLAVGATVVSGVRGGQAGLVRAAVDVGLVLLIALAGFAVVCLWCMAYCVVRVTPGVAKAAAAALQARIRRWGEAGSSEPPTRQEPRHLRG